MTFIFGLPNLSVENELTRQLVETNGLQMDKAQQSAPTFQAALFLGDLFIALSNRDTRDFFTERSKFISYLTKNGIAADCFLRNEGWKKIFEGASKEASPRERATMFANIANLLVLANTLVSETYSSPVKISSAAVSIGQQLPYLSKAIRLGTEITRLGFHGHSLLADNVESKEKFSRGTFMETAAKVASVASSTLAIGGMAASWAGLSSVSTVLGSASGVFGAVKFLATWNENRKTTPLQKLKQEMVTAFDQMIIEVVQKIECNQIDQKTGNALRNEMIELKFFIKSLPAEEKEVTGSIILLQSTMKKLDELKLISKSTTDRINHLITRTLDKIMDKLPSP